MEQIFQQLLTAYRTAQSSDDWGAFYKELEKIEDQKLFSEELAKLVTEGDYPEAEGLSAEFNKYKNFVTEDKQILESRIKGSKPAIKNYNSILDAYRDLAASNILNPDSREKNKAEFQTKLLSYTGDLLENGGSELGNLIEESGLEGLIAEVNDFVEETQNKWLEDIIKGTPLKETNPEFAREIGRKNLESLLRNYPEAFSNKAHKSFIGKDRLEQLKTLYPDLFVEGYSAGEKENLPMPLREEGQIAIEADICIGLGEGENPLIVSPPGTGKTIIFTEVIRNARKIEDLEQIIITTATENNVRQTFKKMKEAAPELFGNYETTEGEVVEGEVGIISAFDKTGKGKPIIICHPRTLMNQVGENNISVTKKTLFINDEGHIATAPKFLATLRTFTNVVFIPLTATPDYNEIKGLTALFGKPRHFKTPHQASVNGETAPYSNIVVEVKLKAGSNKPTKLHENLVEAALDTYLNFRHPSTGQRILGTKTMFHCSTKKQVDYAMELFQKKLDSGSAETFYLKREIIRQYIEQHPAEEGKFTRYDTDDRKLLELFESEGFKIYQPWHTGMSRKDQLAAEENHLDGKTLILFDIGKGSIAHDDPRIVSVFNVGEVTSKVKALQRNRNTRLFPGKTAYTFDFHEQGRTHAPNGDKYLNASDVMHGASHINPQYIRIISTKPNNEPKENPVAENINFIISEKEVMEYGEDLGKKLKGLANNIQEDYLTNKKYQELTDNIVSQNKLNINDGVSRAIDFVLKDRNQFNDLEQKKYLSKVNNILNNYESIEIACIHQILSELAKKEGVSKKISGGISDFARAVGVILWRRPDSIDIFNKIVETDPSIRGLLSNDDNDLKLEDKDVELRKKAQLQNYIEEIFAEEVKDYPTIKKNLDKAKIFQALKSAALFLSDSKNTGGIVDSLKELNTEELLYVKGVLNNDELRNLVGRPLVQSIIGQVNETINEKGKAPKKYVASEEKQQIEEQANNMARYLLKAKILQQKPENKEPFDYISDQKIGKLRQAYIDNNGKIDDIFIFKSGLSNADKRSLVAFFFALDATNLIANAASDKDSIPSSYHIVMEVGKFIKDKYELDLIPCVSSSINWNYVIINKAIKSGKNLGEDFSEVLKSYARSGSYEMMQLAEKISYESRISYGNSEYLKLVLPDILGSQKTSTLQELSRILDSFSGRSEENTAKLLPIIEAIYTCTAERLGEKRTNPVGTLTKELPPKKVETSSDLPRKGLDYIEIARFKELAFEFVKTGDKTFLEPLAKLQKDISFDSYKGSIQGFFLFSELFKELTIDHFASIVRNEFNKGQALANFNRIKELGDFFAAQYPDGKVHIRVWYATKGKGLKGEHDADILWIIKGTDKRERDRIITEALFDKKYEGFSKREVEIALWLKSENKASSYDLNWWQKDSEIQEFLKKQLDKYKETKDPAACEYIIRAAWHIGAGDDPHDYMSKLFEGRRDTKKNFFDRLKNFLSASYYQESSATHLKGILSSSSNDYLQDLADVKLTATKNDQKITIHVADILGIQDFSETEKKFYTNLIDFSYSFSKDRSVPELYRGLDAPTAAYLKLLNETEGKIPLPEDLGYSRSFKHTWENGYIDAQKMLYLITERYLETGNEKHLTHIENIIVRVDYPYEKLNNLMKYYYDRKFETSNQSLAKLVVRHYNEQAASALENEFNKRDKLRNLFLKLYPDKYGEHNLPISTISNLPIGRDVEHKYLQSLIKYAKEQEGYLYPQVSAYFDIMLKDPSVEKIYWYYSPTIEMLVEDFADTALLYVKTGDDRYKKGIDIIAEHFKFGADEHLARDKKRGFDEQVKFLQRLFERIDATDLKGRSLEEINRIEYLINYIAGRDDVRKFPLKVERQYHGNKRDAVETVTLKDHLTSLSEVEKKVQEYKAINNPYNKIFDEILGNEDPWKPSEQRSGGRQYIIVENIGPVENSGNVDVIAPGHKKYETYKQMIESGKGKEIGIRFATNEEVLDYQKNGRGPVTSTSFPAPVNEVSAEPKFNQNDWKTKRIESWRDSGGLIGETKINALNKDLENHLYDKTPAPNQPKRPSLGFAGMQTAEGLFNIARANSGVANNIPGAEQFAKIGKHEIESAAQLVYADQYFTNALSNQAMKRMAVGAIADAAILGDLALLHRITSWGIHKHFAVVIAGAGFARGITLLNENAGVGAHLMNVGSTGLYTGAFVLAPELMVVADPLVAFGNFAGKAAGLIVPGEEGMSISGGLIDNYTSLYRWSQATYYKDGKFLSLTENEAWNKAQKDYGLMGPFAYCLLNYSPNEKYVGQLNNETARQDKQAEIIFKDITQKDIQVKDLAVKGIYNDKSSVDLTAKYLVLPPVDITTELSTADQKITAKYETRFGKAQIQYKAQVSGRTEDQVKLDESEFNKAKQEYLVPLDARESVISADLQRLGYNLHDFNGIEAVNVKEGSKNAAIITIAIHKNGSGMANNKIELLDENNPLVILQNIKIDNAYDRLKIVDGKPSNSLNTFVWSLSRMFGFHDNLDLSPVRRSGLELANGAITKQTIQLSTAEELLETEKQRRENPNNFEYYNNSHQTKKFLVPEEYAKYKSRLSEILQNDSVKAVGKITPPTEAEIAIHNFQDLKKNSLEVKKLSPKSLEKATGGILKIKPNINEPKKYIKPETENKPATIIYSWNEVNLIIPEGSNVTISKDKNLNDYMNGVTITISKGENKRSITLTGIKQTALYELLKENKNIRRLKATGLETIEKSPKLRLPTDKEWDINHPSTQNQFNYQGSVEPINNLNKITDDRSFIAIAENLSNSGVVPTIEKITDANGKTKLSVAIPEDKFDLVRDIYLADSKKEIQEVTTLLNRSETLSSLANEWLDLNKKTEEFITSVKEKSERTTSPVDFMVDENTSPENLADIVKEFISLEDKIKIATENNIMDENHNNLDDRIESLREALESTINTVVSLEKSSSLNYGEISISAKVRNKKTEDSKSYYASLNTDIKRF